VRFGAGIVVGMLLTLELLLWSPRARALDFDWLRSENRHVRQGNARLQAGDAKGALTEYDGAARELPSEGGVHLDRGLALLRAGELGPAREALRLATQPAASATVRADAFYDLGIGFYREADARAAEDKHDEAQQMFKEAADAFKQSLRLRGGDRNSAWNYELARRRITEQQEKQKQDQDQKKQDQDQKKQDQDQKKDDSKSDEQQQADDKQDQPKPDQPKDEQPKQDEQAKKQPTPDQKPDKQPEPKADAQEPQPGAEQPPAVPPEVNRALDALDDGEDNLERVRALNRAARERRKPEKDW
jgi:Ca-activated chloride channel family protein